MKPSRDPGGYIDIADGEKDQVAEGIKRAESAGAVVDHPYDAVEAFGDGVRDPGIDEREHRVDVLAQGMDEPPKR